MQDDSFNIFLLSFPFKTQNFFGINQREMVAVHFYVFLSANETQLCGMCTKINCDSRAETDAWQEPPESSHAKKIKNFKFFMFFTWPGLITKLNVVSAAAAVAACVYGIEIHLLLFCLIRLCSPLMMHEVDRRKIGNSNGKFSFLFSSLSDIKLVLFPSLDFFFIVNEEKICTEKQQVRVKLDCKLHINNIMEERVIKYLKSKEKEQKILLDISRAKKEARRKSLFSHLYFVILYTQTHTERRIKNYK